MKRNSTWQVGEDLRSNPLACLPHSKYPYARGWSHKQARMNHLRVLSIHFYCVLLSVFPVSLVTDRGQLPLTCATSTMFIAIPAVVDNNGTAILDASLSVNNTINDMSNVISTTLKPESLVGFSRRCPVFRMGGEEIRLESELQQILYGYCFCRRGKERDNPWGMSNDCLYLAPHALLIFSTAQCPRSIYF